MPMSGEGPGRESGQMIVADGLVRRYGAVTAVEDVSFEIGRHEVVGLLGHYGADKTTTMKLTAGSLEPSSEERRVGNACYSTCRFRLLPYIEITLIYHTLS